MTRRLLTLILLAGLAATSLSAQGPRGGPPGGGRGQFRMPDPVFFNGPPLPEDFLDLVTLDSIQYNAYRVQYMNFMEATRPQRDSLLEIRRQMRDAFESGGMGAGMPPGGGRQGGRAGGGEGRDKMQKMLGELEKQQKVFDEELKVLLQEPQYKRYEAWRKDEMTRAERQMRERFGGRPQ